jgi:SpoVK/Ycf46/Vps4 family AAA+-type ATPase
MKRAGRFDLILPVLLPDDESRENIIKILLNSTLQNTDKIENSLSETDYKHIAKLTADFSGAELQAVVGETMRRLIKEFLQNKQKINLNLQLFEKILKVYKPPVERRKDYKKMEELAIKDVSFIDMLPATYRLMREKELENLVKE